MTAATLSIAQHPAYVSLPSPPATVVAYTSQPQTLAEWEADGKELSSEDTSLQFRWGDWLNYGVQKWGVGRYEQAESITGYSRGTLYNWAWVARNVPPSLRYPDVHYTAYRKIASMQPHIQQAYVERYRAEKWTPTDLEDEFALSREGREQEERSESDARTIVRDIEAELARRGFGDDVKQEIAEQILHSWVQDAARQQKITCPYCRNTIRI